MNTHDIEKYFKEHHRHLSVLSVVIFVICMSGVFMGIRQSRRASEAPPPSRDAPATTEQASYPVAPRYDQIPDSDWLANQHLAFNLKQLAPPPPSKSKTSPETNDLKELLAERNHRRAFEGAPPTIPHTISQLSSASCITCHSPESPVSISGQTPAKMSHPYFANCTQCHVPSDGLKTLTEAEEDRLVVTSFFHGRGQPGPGSRAFQGAPPTIPHQIWMRQNCSSCHGPEQLFAVPRNHPPSQNCLQCHAPDARLDNREGILNLLRSDQ